MTLQGNLTLCKQFNLTLWGYEALWRYVHVYTVYNVDYCIGITWCEFTPFMLLCMQLRPIIDSFHIEIAKGVKSIKTFTVTTPIKVIDSLLQQTPCHYMICYVMWYVMWCDVWCDMLCDMTCYVICDMLCDVTCYVICDVICCDMIHNMWYVMWCNMWHLMWCDIWCDVMWYVIWCHVIHDMWCDMWHVMWCNMWCDMICDVICDVMWYMTWHVMSYVM